MSREQDKWDAGERDYKAARDSWRPWEKVFGARRRAIDRRLLASMEREIAQAERAQASRTAVGLDPVPMTPNEPKPVHEPPEASQARIARAFGRPL